MTLFIIVSLFLFSFLAYNYKKLTFAGAVSALVVGMITYLGFHYHGLILFGLFFFSANLITTLKGKNDEKEDEIVQKSDARDAFQVLANGGIPMLLSFIQLIAPSPVILCGFVASIASVTADTWASEIGTLTKQKPIHIFTFKRVPAGTSGAMTALGTSAAIVGSFLIASVGIFLWGNNYDNSHFFLIFLTAAGFIGNLFDTILGAIVQVKYECVQCGLQTEKTTHCDKETVQVHGVSWINNDFVNLMCSLIGAMIGISIGFIYF